MSVQTIRQARLDPSAGAPAAAGGMEGSAGEVGKEKAEELRWFAGQVEE